MLMDKSVSYDIIEKVKNIIETADKRINSYHALKTRKSGDNIFIDFHLVFDKEIKLIDAHTISDKIEFTILKEISNSSIMIHLDPYDDSYRDYQKM
jgi:ferrous-iron efflux pump FieF